MKEQARSFAKKAHHGQQRKNSNTAYITHPVRVAERLESFNFSDELICAAYLHDVVEDTPYEIEDIEAQFGSKVAKLVSAHTEDKSKTWKERKQHTVDMIINAEKEVKYLIVADRLDNLIDLEKDIENLGDDVWANFNAGPEKQEWYNKSIVKNMYIGLDKKDIPEFFEEFEDAVKRVFG